jgi:polyisoprenoid-binding protein YceI
MRYIIDPLHSDIQFKIRHLMISSVKGTFTSFRAEMISEKEDFTDSEFWCEIDVASINTRITDRDTHLRSSDFFDVEKHPLIKFNSTSVKREDNQYIIQGILEIKGVGKPVELVGTYNGSDVDHYGQEKFGFDLETKINRADFDLTFNTIGGKNTLLIGDDVSIDISIQMIKSEKK